MADRPSAGTAPTSASSRPTENQVVAQRFARRLDEPFAPQNISSQNMSESALLRIANASEYAAGQLFVIRKILEDSNPNAALTDLIVAVDNLRAEVGSQKP